MSYIVKSGSRYLRYFDPMPPQVNPRGLQPQSSFIAPLAFSNGPGSYVSTLGSETPLELFLNTDILIFGCDYPVKVGLTQVWPGSYVTEDGTSLPYGYSAQSLSSYAPSKPNVLSVLTIPQVLTNISPVVGAYYQEKISGDTVTNTVPVTGFPVAARIDTHDVYVKPTSGPPLDFAPYIAELNVDLNSATTNGPAAYLNAAAILPIFEPRLRQPVILWEGDFTQAIVDNGFKISLVTFNSRTSCELEVVGIWSASFGGDPWEPYTEPKQKVALFSDVAAADAPAADAPAADAPAADAPVVSSKWSVNPVYADPDGTFGRVRK